jgi:hypothetical protein
MGFAGPIALCLPTIGLAAGVLIGVAYFFLALSSSRGMINAGISHDPARPTDPNAAISMGLGAAGIACYAAANSNYPSGFRNFYAACAAAGLLIALANAWRWRGASSGGSSPE